MNDCDECLALAAQWAPSAALESNLYLPLGLAFACALALNALGVNKALRLFLVTGAVFAIAWSGGERAATTAKAKPGESCLSTHDDGSCTDELVDGALDRSAAADRSAIAISSPQP